MSTATLSDVSRGQDEKQIRSLIADWCRALEAKDVDGLVANYAPDAVLFDVKPPFRLKGPAAIRAMWEQCLPHFPKTFKSEHRDLQLTVGDEAAFFHALHHFRIDDEPAHPAAQSWIRVTGCFKKVDGRWLVAHEHVSLPFDCTTGKVAPIPNPDV